MTRIRIGFGTAVVATAVLFFLSGSYFTAGVFIIEILLPVVLRFFLRLETNGMELEMHTRSACRLGQTIEIDISLTSINVLLVYRSLGNRRCAEARSSALVMCAAMIFLA